jgi:Domain of Unknown Function (DUF928)
MTRTNLLSNLAKFSFAVACILLLLNSMPIKIANSVMLVQNPSRRRQPSPKPTPTKAPSPPNPTTPQPVPTRSDVQPPRGPCTNINPLLTGLIPIADVQKTVLTSQEKPTFWFYVPYTTDLIQSVKLIWDGSLEIFLPKPEKPGIISVSIPPGVRPLEDGKQYSLILEMSVVCPSKSNQTKNETKIDSISFLVQMRKLTPSEQNKLNNMNTEQKANFYAQNGFFIDVLGIYSESKKTNPNDKNWAKLLRSVKLEDIIEKPIIDCCTFPNPQSSP